MDRRDFLKTLSVIALGTALRTPLAAALGSVAMGIIESRATAG